MNVSEGQDLFDELRADDQLVIDYPMRKIGICANTGGQILIAVQDSGENATFTLEVEEVTAVCAALLREAHQARPIAHLIETEYEAFEAIQRASRGGK